MWAAAGDLAGNVSLPDVVAAEPAGSAVVALEFEPNAPRQKALDDIRAKVDLARGRFPPDAEPPFIQEQSFADNPVIGVVLHGGALIAEGAPADVIRRPDVAEIYIGIEKTELEADA